MEREGLRMLDLLTLRGRDDSFRCRWKLALKLVLTNDQ